MTFKLATMVSQTSITTRHLHRLHFAKCCRCGYDVPGDFANGDTIQLHIDFFVCSSIRIVVAKN